MEHSSSCSLLNDIRKLKSRAFLLYGTQAEGIVFRPQANISKIQEKRTYGSHGVDNRHPSMIYNCLHAHKIMIIIANKVKESLIIGAWLHPSEYYETLLNSATLSSAVKLHLTTWSNTFSAGAAGGWDTLTYNRNTAIVETKIE